MADRNQRHNRNKPLLPASNPREPPEDGEDGPSSAGGAAGKQPKRAKVTAVACVPCQKRKSKCDGLRPICTSCQQKGRNDCVYDTSSDLRRTSALKQRIDNLQQEVVDLKDILLAMCAAYSSGTGDGLLGLVNQNVGQGDFSRVPELAQVLRTNGDLAPADQARMVHQGGYRQTNPSFGRFPQVAQGFGVNYQGMARDGVEQSDATDEQHDWVLEEAQQQDDANPEPQDYQRGYMYQP